MYPEFLHLGDFTIYSYGVMLATAFMTALYLAYRRAEKIGLEPQVIVDTAIIVLIGSVVGAKLFYIIGHFPEMAGDLDRLLGTLRAGGVFQGGLITAAVLSVGYLIWKRKPVWLIADVIAPSIAIGQSIGRIGCFAAGCCYGKVCDHAQVPWSVNFPPEAITPFQGIHVFRHPTQLYESLIMLAVFFALVWIWKVRKYDGQVFWYYVLIHSVVRGLMIEPFRGDHGPVFLGLTGQQLIAVVTFFTAIAVLVFLRHRGRLTIPAEHKA